MRGDIGIATLILFIVIVLIATIAAVILLQTANAVKTQAQQTSEESQARIAQRISADQVILVVDTNTLSQLRKVRYIWIAVRTAVGSGPVDLRDVTLTFIGGNTVKTAKYIDADGSPEFGDNACETTDPVNDVNYDVLLHGDYFTVVWTNCAGHDEDYVLYPKQSAYIIYVPPEGLKPRESFTITISVAEGGSTKIETEVPDILPANTAYISMPV